MHNLSHISLHILISTFGGASPAVSSYDAVFMLVPTKRTRYVKHTSAWMESRQIPPKRKTVLDTASSYVAFYNVTYVGPSWVGKVGHQVAEQRFVLSDLLLGRSSR